MCLSHLWGKESSPWPWRYGIMSVGHFGHISLFLPLYAILELPYLHGAQNLARKKVRLLYLMTKGWTPLSFVFASPAHPELANF